MFIGRFSFNLIFNFIYIMIDFILCTSCLPIYWNMNWRFFSFLVLECNYHIAPLSYIVWLTFKQNSDSITSPNSWTTSSDHALVLDYLTAWSTKVLSACCQSVTKGHNWHIDYLSVAPFCHGWGACISHICAPSRHIVAVLLGAEAN